MYPNSKVPRTIIPRYSQNFVANTFLVGIHKAVGVTIGRLVVVGGGAGWPLPHIDYDAGLKREEILNVIQTRTIRLPDEDKDITVDVLLIKHTGNVSAEAILKEVTGRYSEVSLYLDGEVKIND